MTVPPYLDVRKTETGLEILRIQNESLLIELIPEAGGKLWTLFDKRRQRQWFWQNPHLILRAVPTGSSYDDNFFGGWDELYPNDASETFDGVQFPDHGELWCQPWQWQIEENNGKTINLYMRAETHVLPGAYERWIIIEGDAPQVILQYRIRNHADCIRRFLWKLHPAFALVPEDRIELPGGNIRPVDLEFSTMIADEGPFRWPMVNTGKTGELIDLSRVPSSQECHKEFVYVTELSDGWCGIVNEKSGARVRIHFPLEIFKAVWLFLEYGAWKGYRTAVLEPCTNWPKLLNQASTQGWCASLEPHESREATVEVVLS